MALEIIDIQNFLHMFGKLSLFLQFSYTPEKVDTVREPVLVPQLVVCTNICANRFAVEF